MLKTYFDLTKFGIVIFVLISGVAGYATGFSIESTFSLSHFINSILGLYFLSSGSLALNQVQEWQLDIKMDRTKKRPIASGKLKPAAAGILAIFFLFTGLYMLNLASPEAGWVGLTSVVLYNGFYTMWWKKKWAFAAIPGAIPGALPVTITYASVNPDIFSSDSVYLFLIMFLWQMPHFWVLAIKYKDDYAKGGFPVLPSVLGVEKTVFQIGLYSVVYVFVALMAPWFVHANILYVFLVLPFCMMVLYEFNRYRKSENHSRWLPFFMWVNVSMLVFISVPVIDRWLFLLTARS